MKLPRRLGGGFVAAMLLTALLAPPALGSGDVFQPADESPDTNPCKKKTVDDTTYGEFKDLIEELLGDKAGVVADIDAQVKGEVDDSKEKPVTVKIEVIDEKSFVKQYAEDVKGLYKDKGENDLKKDAKDYYKSFGAYTYTTKDFSDDGTQIIKIAVFCKPGLRTGTIDSSIRELIVHELVHAKLYTMLVLGLTEDEWPFPDHDDDADNDDEYHDYGGDKEFWDEVKRLSDKLKENLDLSYAPGRRFEEPTEALVVVPSPEGLLVEVPLEGRTTVQMRPLVGGQEEVEIEIVALELVGLHPVLGSVFAQGTALGAVGPGPTGSDFPAESFFDVFYELQVGDGPALLETARLEAAPNHWPPLDVPYLPGIIIHPGPGDGGDTDPGSIVGGDLIDPTEPRGLVALTLVAVDSDGDGLPDFLDPDDDDDGVPDVEDPWPADAKKPKLEQRMRECEVAPGVIALCPWFTDGR